jgi:hypothetical protein
MDVSTRKTMDQIVNVLAESVQEVAKEVARGPPLFLQMFSKRCIPLSVELEQISWKQGGG